MPDRFELDERLANDCFHLGDFELCSVLLMNDNQYPWFILVPKLSGLSELYELSEAQQHQFLRESNQLCSFIKNTFSAEKLNIAALGNVVKQLHIHHIGRFTKDVAWPGPVWNASPAIPYQEEQVMAIKQQFNQTFTVKE